LALTRETDQTLVFGRWKMTERILHPHELSEEDLLQRQVLYVAGYREEGIPPGSFRHLLIQAAFHADRENTSRLSEGFPELIGVMQAYSAGKDLEKYPIVKEVIKST
jgi:hypothetical protein